MAKTSARSKGYRKATNQKKPYLSKKEIIALVVIVAVIALVVTLFNIFYDDGSLKVRGGVVQVSGENSILYNAGKTSEPKYFKVGEIHDVDGYTLESAVFGSDENLHTYTLTPKADDAAYTVRISASNQSAELLGNNMPIQMKSYLPNMETTDVVKLDNDDHAVWYYTSLYTSEITPEETETETTEETESEPEETTEEAEAEIAEETATEAEAETEEAAEEESTESTEEATDTAEESEAETALMYHHELAAYVSNGTTRTICIHISEDVDSEDKMSEDSAFIAVLDEVLGALTYETK